MQTLWTTPNDYPATSTVAASPIRVTSDAHPPTRRRYLVSTTPPNGQGWDSAPPPPAYGAGPQPLRPDEEKMWAILAHVLPLIGLGFIAPLVIWLVFRGRGPYLENQAKESLNFQITVLIAVVVGSILTIVLVGFVILAVVGIGALVLEIMAAVAASRFEWYRYPLTLRLVK
ncbi:hypothetical protein CUD01_10630 [Cellulomonas uda]|uniref:Orotate phosphoribosyltransferase n=2 Tax=Cellulomonas TaxID=1707 RepID=A0A4Y3K7X5_CELUD|nr:hypothetical protein CUD01_10630 [Cellulomonas uda]